MSAYEDAKEAEQMIRDAYAALDDASRFIQRASKTNALLKPVSACLDRMYFDIATATTLMEPVVREAARDEFQRHEEEAA